MKMYKYLKSVLLSLCLPVLSHAAAGDYLFQRENSSGPTTPIRVRPNSNDLLGWSGNTLVNVSRSALGGGGGGSGTVTSVALSMPSIFTVTGSPVTTTGTLAATLATQAANLVWAGPSSGAASAPTFRALVAADIPNLSAVYQPLSAALTTIGGNGSAYYLSRANHTGTQSYTTITGLGTLATQSATITDYLTITAAASTYLTVGGNAGTATALATPRAINGVAFDGTAAITVAASAGTLTGTTLASNVVTSSLTGLGTVTSGTWTATPVADAYVASASTWNAKESALTFSTGLTRSTNTVTVNTSQNIATLSNLTSNGFVKTSGSNGTLSIDTTSYQALSATLTTLASSTEAGLALMDDVDASAQRATLGLGTLATQSGTISDYLTTTAAALTYLPVGGNAVTATALATARAINGINFDGSADITVTAAAGTLTGTTLNATVTTSSLTSVGTISSGTWQGSVIGPAYLGTGSSITTKYLRGDGTWQAIGGGGDALTTNTLDQFADVTQAAGKTLAISDNTTLGGGAHSGTNTGDQTITLTGDVTGSGTGSFAATITAGSVTLADMADMATASVFYRKTAGTGAPEVQTLATLKTDLGLTGTNTGDQTTVSGNAGTATALATPRAIYGNNFDGSAALTQIIASTYGGTGNGFAKFSGPATSEKTFTLPNASVTILTTDAAVTVAQGGSGRATATTAYGLLAAGTTATGAHQTLAAGATTSLLVGGGASALPVWTVATGSGSPVRATSPTLVTPLLGTPASGDLANCTNLPLATGVAGALAFGNGGTGLTTLGTANQVLRTNAGATAMEWATLSSGTVTSVAQSFTGGLISVSGSPVTTSGTLALTVAGTSGGIPYFSSSSTWDTSAALAANAIVIGGGAGVAPSTTTTGTGVVTALGVNTGTAGAFVVNGGGLGMPSAGDLTSCTNLPLTTGVTGTLAIANGGTSATTDSGARTALGLVIGTNVQAYNANTTVLGSTIDLTSEITGTLPVANGGTGLTALGTANQVLRTNAGATAMEWATLSGTGTVTSVAQSFTGGLISVAGSPITASGTLALTVAGTSGGIPYFSSASTWATSAALASNALVIGGGAGAAPATTTTGTGVVTALGVNTGSAGAFVVNGGDAGTPSAIVLTNGSGTAASLTAGTATAADGIKTATTTVSVSGAAAPSSGQVLTATSTTNATWQTPSGGGGGNWVLVSTTTISGSPSTLDFSLSGGYRHYRLELENVYNSADGYPTYLRTSTDGGSTYDSGASDYNWTRGQTTGYAPDSATSSWVTLLPAVGNGTDEGAYGYIDITNPSSTAAKVHLTWRLRQVIWSDVFPHVWEGAARRNSVGDVTHVRLLVSGQTFSGGAVRLFRWSE